MGNANAKLWEAVEEADVRTLCEVLKHKEVDIDHRKEYKLGRRNWTSATAGLSSTDLNAHPAAPSSPSSLYASSPDVPASSGLVSTSLSEVKNEVKHMFQGVDKDVLTPLHVACMRGNREIVQLLMAHGADIHIKAMHERYGPASLRAFRKRGRKGNRKPEKKVPSWSEEDEETGQMRLHKSAKEVPPQHNHRLYPNGRASGHQRSFSSAAASPPNAASLIYNRRLNDDGSSMQRHVSHDDSSVRGRGSREPLDGMEYIKYCQYTALYYACKYRSKEVVYDILLRHIEDAARVRSVRAATGPDPEKAASIEKKLKGLLVKNWNELIEILINHRGDLVASLCEVAAVGHLELVDLLVGLGANVNGEESETVEKVILERKPSKWDTTPPYEYISREDRPLYNACHNGQKEIVEYFLQIGAIVQDEDVNTALEAGFRDIAMILLDAQSQQTGQTRTLDQSLIAASTSPGIDYTMYPVVEPQQLGQQQPQLPPRIRSPSIDQAPPLPQKERLYPTAQQPSYQMTGYAAPSAYPQLNPYGGQQSPPPEASPLGSPPSPPQIIGLTSPGMPAHHVPSPSTRIATPDPYSHQQSMMTTSTTPSSSPQLYSAAPPMIQQQQRNIYGAYAAAQNGASHPYFAQPQAAYHPMDQQSREQRPTTPQPQGGYYQNQPPPQASGPPPSYVQHLQQQQQKQQYQQQQVSLYQPGVVYAQIPLPAYPRAAPPIPSAPQPVYQQPPQQQQQNLYPQQQPQQPPPQAHVHMGYAASPAPPQYVAPSAPPAYMPPQGYAGLAPPVPMHQRKISDAGLAGGMAMPKSDGIMVTEATSGDFNHSEYEVDYNEVEVEKELARGSFGIVYVGKWRGTDVAIKKLVNQNLSQKELEEFHSEVNVMKKLHHPNVLLLMGVCSQPPNLCMITELMTGSLWDLLHRRKEVRLDWKLIMRFITDTARGMNYLHLFKPPVLHRDLKTPNLLVDKDFNVKIADFGLARLKAHVMTGNLGTCQYMAPEVLRNENYTESADVYSFGIIVWEIVARSPPFHGMQTMQIAYSVNQGMRPPIPSHCPLPLRDLMQRCWQQDPRQRPSFSAILNQIKSINL